MSWDTYILYVEIQCGIPRGAWMAYCIATPSHRCRKVGKYMNIWGKYHRVTILVSTLFRHLFLGRSVVVGSYATVGLLASEWCFWMFFGSLYTAVMYGVGGQMVPGSDDAVHKLVEMTETPPAIICHNSIMNCRWATPFSKSWACFDC